MAAVATKGIARRIGLGLVDLGLIMMFYFCEHLVIRFLFLQIEAD
jgi:hypothetical protein